MYGSKCSRPVPVNEPLVREHLTGAKTGCIQLVNKGGTAISRPLYPYGYKGRFYVIGKKRREDNVSELQFCVFSLSTSIAFCT